MKFMNHKSAVIVWMFLVGIIIVSACTTSSKNWSQFRGPDASMIAIGEDLPTEWGEDLNVAWTYEVEGDGWATPVVWGDKVFLASVVAEKINKPGEREEASQEGNQDLYLKDVYRWELSCLDLETGTELWKQVAHQGNPRIKKHARTNYASETPVTDGKRVYVYFGMTGLYCYDMEGELLWEKDLGAFETQRGWGTGSSPLLYNGLIYMISSRGGEVSCLDAETGQIVYQEKIEKVAACWASPWAHDDKIYFMDEKGVTRVIKAGREFEQLYENRLDDRFWASVAVAGDALLFKGDEKLYCIKY